MLSFVRLAMALTFFVCRGWGQVPIASSPEAPVPARDEAKDARTGVAGAAAEWQELFDGRTFSGWKNSHFGGDGEIAVVDGALVLGIGAPLTGVTWIDEKSLPRVDYEIELQARRVDGNDFFCGLTFPYLDSHATLILGGWGGSLVGISSLNGRDASENETMRQIPFEKERWYSVRLTVRDGDIRVSLDTRPIVYCRVRGRKVNTRMEVDPSKPLGIATYATRGEIRGIRLRRLSPRTPPEQGTPRDPGHPGRSPTAP